MEMTTLEALQLLQRQRLVPKQEVREMRNLLRSLKPGQEVVIPSNLQRVADLLWLAQSSPLTPTRH